MTQDADATNQLKQLAAIYGECIWSWSSIETELFQIFAAASGQLGLWTLSDIARNQNLASAFFAVKGVEIRLAMTDALAQKRWPESPQWNAIQKEFDKLRRIRGRLAHIAGRIYPDESGNKPPLVILIEPWPHVAFPLTYRDAKSRGITLKGMLDIHVRFEAVRSRHIGNSLVQGHG